eukprot:3679434-Amphidinium_carterae.2
MSAVALDGLDVRAVNAVPSPVADALMAKGVQTLGDIIQNSAFVPEVLEQLHISNVEARSFALLQACKREASDSWGTSNSARDLLRKAQTQPRVYLPCTELDKLLGNALRSGAGLMEVCGLPGAGKTQFCLQLCASAQLGDSNAAASFQPEEA